LKENLKIDKTLGISSLSLKSLMNVENVKTFAQVAIKSTEDTSNLFKKARTNAQLSGKLLGHFIARNVRFDS